MLQWQVSAGWSRIIYIIIALISVTLCFAVLRYVGLCHVVLFCVVLRCVVLRCFALRFAFVALRFSRFTGTPLTDLDQSLDPPTPRGE